MSIFGELRPDRGRYEAPLRSRCARPARPNKEQTGEEEPQDEQEAPERQKLGGETKQRKVRVEIWAMGGL